MFSVVQNKNAWMFALSLVFFSSLSLYAGGWGQPDAIVYPADNKPDDLRILLGKLLFFDKRLSETEEISCASCHQPEHAWTDGKAKAIGVHHKKGPRNTPTLVNTAMQQSYYWDGRAVSLEEQALEPFAQAHEMNMPLETLVKKLDRIAGYRALFAKAYPEEGVNKATIAKALAAFERTIISNDTLFDRWIRNSDAVMLSQEALEGFALFQKKGKCTSCHDGFNFTLGSFENIGLGDSDTGVYGINGNPIWYGAFKTPTLREVEKTAPYFHDGSVHTLEESVHICGNAGRYKDAKRSPFLRDRNITTDEMHKIVAFLQTLGSDKNRFVVPTVFPE